MPKSMGINVAPHASARFTERLNKLLAAADSGRSPTLTGLKEFVDQNGKVVVSPMLPEQTGEGSSDRLGEDAHLIQIDLERGAANIGNAIGVFAEEMQHTAERIGWSKLGAEGMDRNDIRTREAFGDPAKVGGYRGEDNYHVHQPPGVNNALQAMEFRGARARIRVQSDFGVPSRKTATRAPFQKSYRGPKQMWPGGVPLPEYQATPINRYGK